MNDLSTTLLSQYANSPTLLALIGQFNAAADPATLIDAFYDEVWNIATAQGYGLDLWGRIVGVARTLAMSSGKTFGFHEATAASADPFGQSPFYGGPVASQNVALSDDAFRVLILAKAYANISRAAIPVYNAILRQLFPGRGNAFVCDTGGMNARLTFDFALDPYELAILKQSGAFQPPTGVLFEIMQAPGCLGFAEAAGSAPFNTGIFFGGYS